MIYYSCEEICRTMSWEDLIVLRKMFRLIIILGIIFLVSVKLPNDTYADNSEPTLADYKFEDNANDSSGMGNHGTIHGNVTFADGFSGKGAVFDGASGYMELPQNLIKDHTDFTVSTMFKTSSYGSILGYQNKPALTTIVSEWIPILYIGKDGKMYVNFWDGSRSQKIVTTNVVNDGAWHKVNLTAGANLIRLYVDDQLIGEIAAPVNHLNMGYNQLGVADNIGYTSSENNWFYFNGMLDEFNVVAGSYTTNAISDQTAIALTEGYSPGTQQTKTISVTNTGTGKLTNLAAALSGTNANDFSITQPETILNRDASTSFAVTAKNGLAVGTYTVVVTISAAHMTNVTFTVTQVVSLLSIPENPQNLVSIGGDRQVTLNWDTVTGATYYNVYMSTVSNQFSNDPIADTITNATYNIQNLTNGTTYYFVVKAGSMGGLSAESNQADVTPATVPAAPANVTAAAGNEQATISFTAPSNNGGSSITGYEVTTSPENVVMTGTASPITISGLTNGTAYTFTVKAINSVGKSAASTTSNAVVPSSPPNDDDSNNSGNGNYTPIHSTTPEPSITGIDVLVNGKVENAGTATTTEVNHRSITTIAIDQKKLEDKLAVEGQGAVVTIPVNTKSDVVVGELNGQMVKNMEIKKAVLEIKTDKASYTLPAQQINISAISDQVGKSVALQDIKIRIEIAAPTADTVKVVENAAEKGTFTLVAPPMNFTIQGTYGDTTIDLSRFNAYVERTIAIPDGVDPNKITTGIVVDPDGTVRHVPTKIVLIEGKYYAVIKSLTNSTYSVVWHPREFSDVANHWAKDAVNDMGSRMVIEGTGNGMFSPNQDITRAEFAAIIVRGLGLKLENGDESFSDVKAADWYNSAINTAFEYQLISGFEDGTFRPDDKITREQAMVIISKAMALTKLNEKLVGKAAEDTLRLFTDESDASEWAVSGIADTVQAGIVLGSNGAELAPKAFITRAEVAAIVQRLLEKSELI
jgi:hypothetical protein